VKYFQKKITRWAPDLVMSGVLGLYEWPGLHGFAWGQKKKLLTAGDHFTLFTTGFWWSILVSGEHELTIGAGIAIPESQSLPI